MRRTPPSGAHRAIAREDASTCAGAIGRTWENALAPVAPTSSTACADSSRIVIVVAARRRGESHFQAQARSLVFVAFFVEATLME